MKYTEDSHVLKMTPKSEKDRVYLAEKFTHITHYESICVAIMQCFMCGEGYAPAMGIHTCNETLRQQHQMRLWRAVGKTGG